MTEFEIWCEGYHFLPEEQFGVARLLGKIEARSFSEAVMRLAVDKGIKWVDEQRLTFDEQDNGWNVFGCRLFDNETEARKLCG